MNEQGCQLHPTDPEGLKGPVEGSIASEEEEDQIPPTTTRTTKRSLKHTS